MDGEMGDEVAEAAEPDGESGAALLREIEAMKQRLSGYGDRLRYLENENRSLRQEINALRRMRGSLPS